MPIYIDNKLMSSVDVDTSNIEIEYNNDNTKSISQAFKVQGAAFEIIDQKIIQNPNGRLKEVPFRAKSDCCDIDYFTGVIRGDTVSFRHGGCDADINVIESNSFTQILDNLRTKTLEDLFINPIRRAVPNVKFKERQPAIYLGVGSKGLCPSPNIRKMIQYFCADNGILFDRGSILNADPYRRMVLFHMPNTTPKNRIQNIILENLPVWTMEDLLNNLAIVFNADWYIDRENLILYFDRKDQIRTPKIVNIDNQDNIELDCTFIQDKPYAAIDIEWTIDGFDKLTSRDEEVGKYNDVITWNPDESQEQDGLKRVQIPFAPSAGIMLFVFGGIALNPKYVALQNKITGVPRLLIVAQTDNNKYEPTFENDRFTAEAIERNWHSIDNPREQASYKRFDYTLTFTASCDFLTNFNQRDKLQYDGMTLTIQQARINWETKEVSISGYLV